MSVPDLALRLAAVRKAEAANPNASDALCDRERELIREMCCIPVGSAQDVFAKVCTLLALMMVGDHDDLWLRLGVSIGEDLAVLSPRYHAAILAKEVARYEPAEPGARTPRAAPAEPA